MDKLSHRYTELLERTIQRREAIIAEIKERQEQADKRRDALLKDSKFMLLIDQVFSYTNKANQDGLEIAMSDLKSMFPNVTEQELQDILKSRN